MLGRRNSSPRKRKIYLRGAVGGRGQQLAQAAVVSAAPLSLWSANQGCQETDYDFIVPQAFAGNAGGGVSSNDEHSKMVLTRIFNDMTSLTMSPQGKLVTAGGLPYEGDYASSLDENKRLPVTTNHKVIAIALELVKADGYLGVEPQEKFMPFKALFNKEYNAVEASDTTGRVRLPPLPVAVLDVALEALGWEKQAPSAQLADGGQILSRCECCTRVFGLTKDEMWVPHERAKDFIPAEHSKRWKDGSARVMHNARRCVISYLVVAFAAARSPAVMKQFQNLPTLLRELRFKGKDAK